MTTVEARQLIAAWVRGRRVRAESRCGIGSHLLVVEVEGAGLRAFCVTSEGVAEVDPPEFAPRGPFVDPAPWCADGE